MEKLVQVRKTLIIGWAVMRSKLLSQLTLMTIYNQNKKLKIKRDIFWLTINNVCVVVVACIQWKQKGKYTPGNPYNQTKGILFKRIWGEEAGGGIFKWRHSEFN